MKSLFYSERIPSTASHTIATMSNGFESMVQGMIMVMNIHVAITGYDVVGNHSTSRLKSQRLENCKASTHRSFSTRNTVFAMLIC